jgi:hypothetical protein
MRIRVPPQVSSRLSWYSCPVRCDRSSPSPDHLRLVPNSHPRARRGVAADVLAGVCVRARVRMRMLSRGPGHDYKGRGQGGLALASLVALRCLVCAICVR